MLLKLLLDPADADADFFVNDATGATSPLTQLQTATPDGLAHQVNITSAANLSGITFTLTGTDADDNVITEDVTGPNATTVESTKYFKTLTSVEISATLGANTVDLGFVDEFVSPTIPLEWRLNAPSRWFGDQNGTINWSVDFAIADPGVFQEQADITWKNPSTSLESETADSSAFVEVGAGYTAARVRVASYTNTADLTMYAVQPELPA